MALITTDFLEDVLPLPQVQSVLHHKTVYLHYGTQPHCLCIRQKWIFWTTNELPLTQLLKTLCFLSSKNNTNPSMEKV